MPNAAAICKALYCLSSRNCESVSLMFSGVSVKPIGIGMIPPVPELSRPAAYSWIPFFSASTFASLSPPVYCNTAFAVMPDSYSLLSIFCALHPPSITPEICSRVGIPVTPSFVRKFLKCSTSAEEITNDCPPMLYR